VIPLDRWDPDALAAEWTAAAPFPHLVFDSFLEEAAFRVLHEAALGEPLFHQGDEIYQHRGGWEPPGAPLLRAFGEDLARKPLLDLLGRITGRRATQVSLRAYRYDRGDYLLPHTDFRPGEERVLAFAYYLAAVGGVPLRGGALELFDCAVDGSSLTGATSAKLIEPKANRLALFEVSGRALHQVREVQRGQRLSLAGWFLA